VGVLTGWAPSIVADEAKTAYSLAVKASELSFLGRVMKDDVTRPVTAALFPTMYFEL
jgi:hypothetical protein